MSYCIVTSCPLLDLKERSAILPFLPHSLLKLPNLISVPLVQKLISWVHSSPPNLQNLVWHSTSSPCIYHLTSETFLTHHLKTTSFLVIYDSSLLMPWQLLFILIMPFSIPYLEYSPKMLSSAVSSTLSRFSIRLFLSCLICAGNFSYLKPQS